MSDRRPRTHANQKRYETIPKRQRRFAPRSLFCGGAQETVCVQSADLSEVPEVDRHAKAGTRKPKSSASHRQENGRGEHNLLAAEPGVDRQQSGLTPLLGKQLNLPKHFLFSTFFAMKRIVASMNGEKSLWLLGGLAIGLLAGWLAKKQWNKSHAN